MYIFYADKYLRSVHYEKAKFWLKKFLNNKISGIAQTFEYEAWANLSLCYARLKNHFKAIDTIKKALEILEPDFHSLIILGWLYLRIDNYKFAEETLNTALDNAKTGYEKKYAFLNLGFLFTQLQNYDKARLYIKKALNIDSNFRYALVRLGNIYKIHGKLEKAYNIFNRAVDYNLEDVDYKLEDIDERLDVWFGMGEILTYLEEKELAVRAYKYILNIFPNNSLVLKRIEELA